MFRKILIRCAAVAAMLLSVTGVQAEEWPTGPVTIYVGFSAGGANSNVTRLLADALTKRLGQPVVVEHRPGAGGRVAASLVAGEPADGSVFFMGAPGILVLSKLLYKDVPYSLKDFEPVSYIGRLPYILLVNNDLPVTSVEQLIDYAKQNPGALNHGSTGSGPIFVQGLFAQQTGTKFENVLYQGTPDAVQDLVRGDIQFMFDLIPGVTPQIASKEVRPLAVSSPARSQAYPDLPTVVEAGVDGVDATNWYGIVAPAGTPSDIVSRMSKELAAIVRDPAVAERMIAMGVEPVGSGPAEFKELIDAEQKRWTAIAETAGIVPE